MREGAKWSPTGPVDQLWQILITLARNGVRIRIKVKIRIRIRIKVKRWIGVKLIRIHRPGFVHCLCLRIQSCCYLGAAEDQRDPGVGQGRPTRAGLCDCLRQHPDVHLQYWPEIQVSASPHSSMEF